MNIGSVPPAQVPLPVGSSKTVSSPRPVLFSLCLLLAALCLGALVRSLGSPFLAECFQPVPVLDLSGLLALVAGLFSAVLFHEAGHLLAAIMNDFEVSGVSIGPFRFVRLGASWEMILEKNRLFEASVSAFPQTKENWRRRMLVVVAAGPIATFVTGFAVALLLHPVGGEDNWLTWLLRAFVQVSFFIFVLGLVPNGKSLLNQNDAALLQSLWRNGPQADELFLYHLVLQQQRAGTRPRNYPLCLIYLLAHFEGRPDFMALFATTIASWAFDRNDAEIGGSWDRRALVLSAHCGFHSRNLVRVNSACFDIIYRQNLIASGAKIDKLDLNKIASPYLRHRAKAAANLAARQVPEALADIAAARFALPEHLQGAGVEYLFLGHLHAAALAVQPDELVVRAQKPKMVHIPQTSLAMI
jgi:Peptidase family M50